MIWGWHCKAVIRVFKHLQNVGRTLRHLLSHSIVEPLRPIRSTVLGPPVDVSQK